LKRVIVLFLCVIMMAKSGCSEPMKGHRAAKQDASVQGNLVQESWNIRIALTQSGLSQGILEAEHGSEYKTKQGSEYHFDHTVKVMFFDSEALPSIVITAEQAVIHDNWDIDFSGNVVMKSGDGVVMKTEHLQRSACDSIIRSDRFVTISRQEETIRGEGFEGDQALKRYRIFRGNGEAFIRQK